MTLNPIVNNFEVSASSPVLGEIDVAFFSFLLRLDHVCPVSSRCFFPSQSDLAQQPSADIRTLSSPIVIGYFNRAALLQLRWGYLARAEALCTRAIDLCSQMLRANHSIFWARVMLEPYVNLGRLFSAMGRSDEALKIFHDVYQASSKGEAISIYGYQVPIQRLIKHLNGLVGSAAEQEPYIGAAIMFLTESARCLLTAGQFERCTQFFSDLPCHDRFESSLIAELTIASFLGLNDFSRAMIAIDYYERQMANEGRSRLGAHMLRADVHSLQGRGSEAQVSTEKVLFLLDTAPALKKRAAPLYARSAICMFLCGRAAKAWQYATTALNLSGGCGASALRAQIVLAEISTTTPTFAKNENEHRAALKNQCNRITHRYERALAYLSLCRLSMMKGEMGSAMSDFVAARALASTIQTMDAHRLLALIDSYSRWRNLCSEVAYTDAHSEDLEVRSQKEFDFLMGYTPQCHST